MSVYREFPWVPWVPWEFRENGKLCVCEWERVWEWHDWNGRE